MNEFEATERENIVRVIKQVIEEEKSTSDSESDVDDDGDGGYDIAKLTTNATDTQVINKINEIINQINKSLRDYRI